MFDEMVVRDRLTHTGLLPDAPLGRLFDAMDPAALRWILAYLDATPCPSR